MKLTWFGHSAFRVELPSSTILIDPFLTGNPSFDGNAREAAAGCSHIVLTHGHSDHVGDTIAIAEATGATVISNFDLCMWLNAKGVEKIDPANTGGTVHHDGFSVSFTIAHHSSAQLDEAGISHSLGHPNGIVLRADGEKVLYHMGDTDIFGDMALVRELYAPDIGIVPIGDRFTMGARSAALACKKFFSFETIIPCHYASFPGLDQSADKFIAEMGDDASSVIVPGVCAGFDL